MPYGRKWVCQHIRILPMLRVILDTIYISVYCQCYNNSRNHLHIRLLQTQQVIVEHRSLTHLQQMRHNSRQPVIYQTPSINTEFSSRTNIRDQQIPILILESRPRTEH